MKLNNYLNEQLRDQGKNNSRQASNYSPLNNLSHVILYKCHLFDRKEVNQLQHRGREVKIRLRLQGHSQLLRPEMQIALRIMLES